MAIFESSTAAAFMRADRIAVLKAMLDWDQIELDWYWKYARPWPPTGIWKSKPTLKQTRAYAKRELKKLGVS